ncbi:hypothetical protein SLS53_000537 [Cytospora paraplurivora]|uniref:Uncharacterized protein n=1 Tax=Cytospora paraplurivora TaxID=2898453 RepID=A0AAN9UL30_9PEZI
MGSPERLVVNLIRFYTMDSRKPRDSIIGTREDKPPTPRRFLPGAETAPVGSILSARLHPADTTPHAAPTGEGDEPGPQSQSTSALREGRRQTPQQQRADILFGNEDAPYNLVRAARAKTFLVQGRTPYVTINRQLLFRGTQIELRRSRVLHIIGAPDEEGFDEETIRAVLQSSPTAMEAVGALGVSSEPVETRDEVVGAGEDGGAAPRTIRTMEWRFFDTAQGKVFKRVLREHFGMRLVVRSAPDPCWDYRAMEQYLQRLSGVRSGGGRGGGGGGQLLRQHRGPAAPPAGVEVEPSTPVWPAYFMETAIRTREDKPTKDKLAEESEAAPEQPTETAIETREDKPAEATEVNETVPEQPTSTDKQ